MSVAVTAPAHRSAWVAPLAALVALWVAIVLLHWETATAMVRVWSTSETFTHAFLVPPISLWLVWRIRHELAPLVPRVAWVWLLPMAGLSGLWLSGHLVVVNAATQFALVGLMVLAVPLVVGTHVARAVLFPLLFLFFAVPFGDFLLPLLMEWTADFTVLALQLTGIPVYREGLQFVIPSGNWSVVEACSGVRYLIASLMVGALFAYLNYRSTSKRWIFIGVAIVTPILANWLRAYFIVMLGHLSNNTIAVGVDHLIYGWVFFGIVIMVMFMLGARWAEPDDAARVQLERHVAPEGKGAPAGIAALAAVGLLALLPALVWALDRSASQAAAPRVALPASLAGWQREAPAPVPLDWAPNIVEPRAKARGDYVLQGDRVSVHLGYFRAQDYRSKLVSSIHGVMAADDNTWNRHRGAPLTVETGSGTVVLRMERLQGSPSLSNSRSAAIHVAQVYWVDGKFTASGFEAKWRNALGRLLGHGDDGALLMLHVVAADEASARAQLQAFGRDALPALGQALMAVQAQR